MAYIYKITNDINQKIYIGKTNFTIEKRWQEHCKDSKKMTLKNRPLYAAMRKYGIEHFHIQQIEKCEDSIASQREQYWIGFYEGYTKGYNATKGGEGACLYNHNKILSLLKEGDKTAKQIAKEIGCCEDLVEDIAKINNIFIANNANKFLCKKIICFDKKELKEIQSFLSEGDAVQWLVDTKKCAKYTPGAKSHIADAAKGKRKTAYGYCWKYAN